MGQDMVLNVASSMRPEILMVKLRALTSVETTLLECAGFRHRAEPVFRLSRLVMGIPTARECGVYTGGHPEHIFF